eukprot:s5939_g5.t1
MGNPAASLSAGAEPPSSRRSSSPDFLESPGAGGSALPGRLSFEGDLFESDWLLASPDFEEDAAAARRKKLAQYCGSVRSRSRCQAPVGMPVISDLQSRLALSRQARYSRPAGPGAGIFPGPRLRGGFAVIKSGQDEYSAYRGVPFGLATAPLLWGRTAAWLGRATQAIHLPGEHRLQIYVDDPAGIVKGSRDHRDHLIGKTLALWAALGARIALHKADRGRKIKWIGANYQVIPGGVRVAIDAERIQKLTHTVQEGLKPKGLVHGMRSLAGELSWIAGLIPTIRPFVNMIWAAIYEMGRQNALAKQGKSEARIRPADAVFAKSVHIPLQWMRLFLQGHHGGLQRVRRVSDRYATPQWVFRTDASTTGMGGILLDHQGKPVRWWAAPLPEGALRQLQVQAGDPGLMTVYELLALLCSVHIWKAYVRNCRLGILAQLDSESALRVAVKLASPHAAVNRVAAELALLLEELCADAITGQHWPNEVNVEADALSRLGEGYEVPVRLRALPRDWAPPLQLRLPAASISKQLDWHSERELRGGPGQRVG